MNHPKYILSQYGLRPKKSLGQNFIYDQNILAQIAGLADLTDSDQVLEIGPGIGGLTGYLAKKAGHVVAVELDQRFLPILEKQLEEFPNITLVRGDILDLKIDEYFSGQYKAVGNVPYYITGAILKHLYTGPFKPTLSVLTVQEEVANRIMQVPGEMNLLAISVQLFSEPRKEMALKAGAFWPRPDVDSAVIVLRSWKKSRLPEAHEARFFRLVSAGFGQKRKQMKKGLRTLGYSNAVMNEAFVAANIDDTRRPQTLSVDEWIKLYWTLESIKPV